MPAFPSLCAYFRSVVSERLHEEGEGIVCFCLTWRGESKDLHVLCRNGICLFLPAWYNEVPLSDVQQHFRSILVITLLHSGSEVSGSGKWQGGWVLIIFKVPSNPSHSMTLRFNEELSPVFNLFIIL